MAAQRSIAPLLLLSGLCLAACTGAPPPKVTEGGAAGVAVAGVETEQPKLLQITDIPMPRDAKINGDATLVMGTNDRWLGRVVLRTAMSAVETYNHFFLGMPGAGWDLLSALQGKVSILTFTNGDRVATVQVEAGTMGGGATATIVVSPRQSEPHSDR